jgi:hypothetical protein
VPTLIVSVRKCVSVYVRVSVRVLVRFFEFYGLMYLSDFRGTFYSPHGVGRYTLVTLVVFVGAPISIWRAANYKQI